MTNPPPNVSPAPTSAPEKCLAILAALALIVLPLANLAWHHLASPNLWFDESGQYWQALGLHHFSAPNAPHGGWAKIVEFGRLFNSDPGGFTFLLREWIAIFGSSPLALKSLPFIFQILTSVILYLAARRAGSIPLLAVLAATVPLGFPMLLDYSTEIRAYSMEACAVAFLFFVPFWMDGESSKQPAWLIGCIAALLADSRYSSFLFAAVACLTVLLPLKPWRQAVVRAALFALPLIVMVAISYQLFARYQAGGTHRAPAYTDSFLLQGKNPAVQLALLRENFLSREAYPLLGFLVFAPFFAWFGPQSLLTLRRLTGRTIVFTVLSVLILATASYFGKLPWAIHTRWSIGYQALSACCLALSLIIVGCWLGRIPLPWIKRIAFTTLAVGFASGWGWQISQAVSNERPYYETTATELQTLARSPRAKQLRFYIQPNASPTVRYLCEAGPYKGTFGYPEQFYFETGDDVTAARPIAGKDFDVIVLTHFSFLDAYRSRIQDGTVEIQSKPQPSCLILIKP